eukprot:scaffold12477_cov51-Phaeocystis_antarctica.AAC.2
MVRTRLGKRVYVLTTNPREASYLVVVLRLRLHVLLLQVADYMFGQNISEHNPAPSPSGHPLLSGPPT